MRVVEHRDPQRHKLLHIEADGCVIHVTIGLHDPAGNPYTSVEVTPDEPDDDGCVWQLRGPATVVVRRLGAQILAGDAQPAADPDPPGSGS